MCMILNPDVQMKAQLELDSVIGADRLPVINDREDLPYLRSVVAEVYRFAPAVPLCMSMFISMFDTHSEITPGVPHASNQDDVYEGYFLPKGTWIMPNIWLVIALYSSHSSNLLLGICFTTQIYIQILWCSILTVLMAMMIRWKG